ncbi:MAG TPA: prepilin-type N-terminal cleavage/methylation domain-containing protein, partial [Labilithrix sp.]|nr:prepilin-type N-terminal cleavage/methylation domain-containing protein [Labilithrix sp.]
MKRLPSKRRGFTLVELMIAMVMGLIIALAAVGLARTATNTFFEQARISGVEANVRAASERLRSDLSRVAYMSTPNIHFDPKIARVPGTVGAPYRVTALADLQGIRITPATATEVNSTKNALSPHDVYVAGNLTTDDVYRGQFLATGVGCGGTGGAQIRLSGRSDAAVRRLFNGETDAATIVQMTQLAFMPGERMDPPQTGHEYAVQVMDMRGCFNYMTICGVGQTTELETVDLFLKGDNANSILTTQQLGGDTCGAQVMEEVAVAPVQRVRWFLASDLDTRRSDPATEGAGAGSEQKKINLNRQLLAADGATAIG